VEELDGGGVEARGIAEVGERHERARQLRRPIDALGRVDADPEPGDQRVELTRWERAEDLDETTRAFLRLRWPFTSFWSSVG